MACFLCFGVFQIHLHVYNYARYQVALFLDAQGFVFSDFLVEGNKRTPFKAVWERLDLEEGDRILALDLTHFSQTLEQLPWVRKAIIRRQLPGQIQIRLIERSPSFLHQEGKTVSLIDEQSRRIPIKNLKPFNALPFVVGKGGREKGLAFLKVLNQYPELWKQMEWVRIVDERRFDLQLKDGPRVQLPEKGAQRAIAKLYELWKNRNDSWRGQIDLRIPGKVFLSPFAPKDKPPRLHKSART